LPEGLHHTDTDLADLPQSIHHIYTYPNGDNGQLIIETTHGIRESRDAYPEAAQQPATVNGQPALCVQGTVNAHGQWQTEADTDVLEWTAGDLSYHISHSGLGLDCETLLRVAESIELSSPSPITPTDTPSPTPAPLTQAAIDSCQVTVPNGNLPPGVELPPDLEPQFKLPTHGDNELWVGLEEDGKVRIDPEIDPDAVRSDGSLRAKFPWWRGVQGQLIIVGQRLDAPAPPLGSRIPSGYGNSGFQATSLHSPSEGCWEVTGSVGDASLTFVTLVIKES
jgi:hypothetical protein